MKKIQDATKQGTSSKSSSLKDQFWEILCVLVILIIFVYFYGVIYTPVPLRVECISSDGFYNFQIDISNAKYSNQLASGHIFVLNDNTGLYEDQSDGKVYFYKDRYYKDASMIVGGTNNIALIESQNKAIYTSPSRISPVPLNCFKLTVPSRWSLFLAMIQERLHPAATTNS
jgi:hypothetical protein